MISGFWTESMMLLLALVITYIVRTQSDSVVPMQCAGPKGWRVRVVSCWWNTETAVRSDHDLT